MNGLRGDHPLTDILEYGIDVFGAETDGLIRKIAKLCSHHELHEWWDQEIGWGGTNDLVPQKATAFYAVLLDRAEKGGWEID